MKRPSKKKLNIGVRIAVGVFLLAIIVIIITASVKTRDDLSVENVLNTIATMWSREERATEYDYEKSGDFALLDDGFAIVSHNGIHTFDVEGDEAMLHSFQMENGCIDSNGKRAVVYDIGGTSVKYIDLENVLADIENEKEVLCAAINEEGWFVVGVREDSYTSSVTVYNDNGTAVYQWYCGEGYILSAQLSGKSLLVLSVSETGSDLVRMKITETEEATRFHLDGEVIYDFREMASGRTALLTESALIFLNEKCVVTSRYDFEGQFLRAYDLSGTNVLLALYADQVSQNGFLVTVGTDAKENNKCEVSSYVKDISYNSKYYAVLFEDKVVVSDFALKEKSTYENVSCSKILALPDGSAIAAGEFMATVLFGGSKTETPESEQ